MSRYYFWTLGHLKELLLPIYRSKNLELFYCFLKAYITLQFLIKRKCQKFTLKLRLIIISKYNKHVIVTDKKKCRYHLKILRMLYIPNRQHLMVSDNCLCVCSLFEVTVVPKKNIHMTICSD